MFYFLNLLGPTIKYHKIAKTPLLYIQLDTKFLQQVKGPVSMYFYKKVALKSCIAPTPF